ncbi:thiosulfate/3-mercaptopyruvate sulfurtransferase [Mariniflexile fucanivorans]|uniref:Thiosulfate/3-mercaptopyruvate sulfurtransferase n=1 Tax=Mariniflexile fucanivorans TaxID=264023 RepID=A0A4R1RBP1_9FLAO|nr:sulfurtransferase [Mariniflexile fucanivorans]TCL63109.1 thiosulfate/3-mercaptopyruvate sulfurtransferase [Mariniflexile fucanivorans]
MAKINISNSVVSVSWLHDNLKAENLIVLDGTINKVFDKNQLQIPNTRLFDIKNKFSDASAPFPSTFPSEKQFQESAQELGINSDSALVVYDDKGIYSCARVWWLFKAFGFDNVAVLDGGFPAWKKAGFSTESMKLYTGELGDFEAKLKPEFMKFFKDMKKASETKSHTIIDARSEARFKSLEAEPREGLRMGTIPNSVNLPFEDLLENNQFLSKDSMEAKFQKLAKKNEPIIFSCGSGITACVLALGATMSGYKNISVYDGSWTEWGSLVPE